MRDLAELARQLATPPLTELRQRIEAQLADVRREALEEAAKLAEAQEDEKDCASEPFDGGSGTMGYAKACDHIAAAIRKLATS